MAYGFHHLTRDERCAVRYMHSGKVVCRFGGFAGSHGFRRQRSCREDSALPDGGTLAGLPVQAGGPAWRASGGIWHPVDRARWRQRCGAGSRRGWRSSAESGTDRRLAARDLDGIVSGRARAGSGDAHVWSDRDGLAAPGLYRNLRRRGKKANRRGRDGAGRGVIP